MDPVRTLEAAAVGAVSVRVRALSGSLADPASDLAGVPLALHDPLRAVSVGLPIDRHPDAVRTMARYCAELDDIAAAITALDERELELQAQLTWWGARITQLEAQTTGAAGGSPADHGVAREISLFRGRISGAQSMVRHYAHERSELGDRYAVAHERCGAALDELLTT